MKKRKPIATTFLSILLILSLLPVQALAAEDVSASSTAPESTSIMEQDPPASSSVSSSASAEESASESTTSLAPSSSASESESSVSSMETVPSDVPEESSSSQSLAAIAPAMAVPALALPAGNIIKLSDGQTLLLKDNNEYAIEGGASGIFNSSTAVESNDLSNTSRESYTIRLENTQPVKLSRMIAKGNLTLVGTGPLIVENTSYPAIRAQFGTLQFEEGTQVTAISNSTLSAVNGNFVNVNGSLQVSGASTTGVQATSILTVGAAGRLITTGKDQGAYVYTGSNTPVSPEIGFGRILVEGYLEATGGIDGIYAYGGLTVNGGTATGNGGSGYGIKTSSFNAPVEASGGANVSGTGSQAGISADNIWANASQITGNGGQYGIKNTHRQGTRSAIEALNGSIIKGVGTQTGVAYVDNDQTFTSDQGTYIAQGSQLIAIGGEIGYSSTYCGLWAEGAGTSIDAQGAKYGLHLQNGKIYSAAGAVVTGTSTASGSSAITTNASITANGAVIRGKSPAFGPGFAAVYRQPEAGSWRIITALNQGKIEEYYSVPETATAQYQLPFADFANMADYSTYQSWELPTEDLLEVDFTAKQGIRALDLLATPMNLTVTRTGSAQNEPVVLADSAEHRIYIPLLLQGNIRQYTLTVQYQNRQGQTIAAQEQLVRDKNTQIVTADFPIKTLANYVFIDWKNNAGNLQGNQSPGVNSLQADQTIVLVYGQDKGGTGTDPESTSSLPPSDPGLPGDPDHSDAAEDITLQLFWADTQGQPLLQPAGLPFYQNLGSNFTRPGTALITINQVRYLYKGFKIGDGFDQGLLQSGSPNYGPVSLDDHEKTAITYVYEKEGSTLPADPTEALEGRDIILYTDEVAEMTSADYLEKGLVRALKTNGDGTVSPIENLLVDASLVKGEAGLYPLTFTTQNGTTVTILVKVIEREYTITFRYHNDSPDTYAKSPAGKTVTAPGVPTKQGYLFQGWYRNEEKWDFSTGLMPKAPLLLEARWKAAPAVTPEESLPPAVDTTTTTRAQTQPGPVITPRTTRILPPPSSALSTAPQDNIPLLTEGLPSSVVAEGQPAPLANLNNPDIPLSGPSRPGSWSLANLLLSLLSLFLMISAVLLRMRKQYQRRNLLSLLQLLLLIATLCLFLITTNFLNPMVFINTYTLLFVLLTVTQAITTFLHTKKRDEADENAY